MALGASMIPQGARGLSLAKAPRDLTRRRKGEVLEMEQGSKGANRLGKWGAAARVALPHP